MNTTSTRTQLYSLLGDLPDRARPVEARLLSTERHDGFEVERLVLDLNGMEEVPALFARPLGASGRLPMVLFNHSHGGFYKVGKTELLKPAPYMQPTSYAADLTARGYGVLAIDHWCFGERSTRTEGAWFRETLWRGQVMWGLMVYDSLKAIDYLATRADVDLSRLATLGMSMGSTMAWWVAALDERVKVCIDICCLTDFDDLIAQKGLEGHGVYYYVPGLLKHFSTAQINALIAPRAHLALAGLRDALTPVAGLDRIERELNEVYREQGVPERWRLSRYDVAHQETPGMRSEVLEWLERWNR